MYGAKLASTAEARVASVPKFVALTTHQLANAT